MKIFKRLMVCLVCSNPYFSVGQGAFYYGFDSKIAISAVPNEYVLRIKGNIPESLLSNITSSDSIDSKTYIVSISNSNVEQILQEQEVLSLQPTYIRPSGTKMLTTEEIVMLPKKEVSRESVEDYLRKHGIVEIRWKQNGSGIAVLEKAKNTLQLANRLYESRLFTYCYPNFYFKLFLNEHIPNDAYFYKQSNLKNTGQTVVEHSGTMGIDINATSAWDITKGSSSMIIAVIDEGVTADHHDLPNSRQVRLNGSDFSNIPAGNDPSPTGDGNHGNACAGIIAATMDNNLGIAGIAPRCMIMPIKLPFGQFAPNYTSDAIDFAVANNAKIINCSFSQGDGDPNLVPATVVSMQNAINANVAIVFSAGNNASHLQNDGGYVGFPGSANINGLMAVGACDRDGFQAEYSPTSAKLDFVAPSHKAYPNQISTETYEFMTIDIPWTSGYNPCNSNCISPESYLEEKPSNGPENLDYTARFGGTSAAAPQVAGTIALIWDVNPCLSVAEVEELLKSTCKQVGGYSYSSGRNDWLGAGLIDAGKAVSLAGQLYFQNDNVTSTENYLFHRITAGENVTTQKPIGIYSIQPSGSVTFRAKESIFLEDGFEAKGGSFFDAYIDNGYPCNEWTEIASKGISSTTFNKSNFQLDANNKENGPLIYPNPAKDIINVDYNLFQKAKISISLTDMYGRTVASLNEFEASGNHHHVFKTMHQTGLVVVTVCKDGICSTTKIIACD